ncbi:unnamed protein product [Cuscuta campestris]|uniref:Reverse transcriptase Ty1/copia-type domain-containing protein n=1 Tax=Cuscuta campestris TaxID=132261 RepID=A0A484M667_9ASTE|nr:unnamed protein product [Cuscuta campestris]
MALITGDWGERASVTGDGGEMGSALLLNVFNLRPLHRFASEESLIQQLKAEFSMTDMGDLHFFLGINVQRTATGLFLHQTQFIHDILEWAGMVSCRPISTPVDTKAKLSSTAGSALPDLSFYREDFVCLLQRARPGTLGIQRVFIKWALCTYMVVRLRLPPGFASSLTTLSSPGHYRSAGVILSTFAERVVVFATRRMSQAAGNDRQVVPHGEPEHMSTISTRSVSSVDSSRTFVLGKRRKNKRQSYESKERYQRAHSKARIAKLRIWKRRKAAWERDDQEETFSVDTANSICGAGGENPPVDSARLDDWEWVAS